MTPLILAAALVASPTWPRLQEDEELVAYRLFVATASVPYESHDWGESWHRLGDRLAAPVRTFLCLGPRAFAGGAEGLYASSDYGLTWSHVASWKGGAVTTMVSSSYYAVEPVLFVGTEDGLYRSRDDGGHWERIGAKRIRGTVEAVAWPGPSLFAAASRGLYRSDDGGDTWIQVGDGLPPARVLSLALSRFFARDPFAFAGTDGEGIYRSGDGGRSFESIRSPGKTIWCLFWWGASLFAGTEAGAFVSHDAGQSWERLAGELVDSSVYAIHVPAPEAPSGSDILLGTEQGVFKSSNGGLDWRHLTRGLGPVPVRGFANFPIPNQSPAQRQK